MQTAENIEVRTLERRKEQRKQALMHAFVSDFNDLVDLKCVIRDISKNGCRIASSYVEDLPQLVRITPEGFDKPMIGKVIWRNSKFAGINFVSAAEAESLQAKQEAEVETAEPAGGFFSKLFSFATLRRRSGQVQRGDERAQTGLPGYGARALNSVRKPLESIKSLLGLLMGDSIRPIPKRAKSIIKAAHSNAAHAEALLGDALHAENIEAGNVQCRMEPLELVEFVSDAALLTTGFAAKYSVRYEVQADVERARVNGDPARLQEVMTAMLSAAARLSPVGEKVFIRIGRSGDGVRVTVSDSGVGATTLHGDADGKHVPHPGDDDNGIGFDVARAILKQHGADLHVEAGQVQGTSAWFELPEIKT